MVSYSLITQEDLPQIIYLHETYLNSGSYIRSTIEAAFLAGKYVGYKACDGNKIIGFFSVQEGIIFTYPHEELEKHIHTLVCEREIYTVDGIIVLEEYRNRGIAGELLCLMKEYILKRKENMVLIEMWIYPDGMIPAEKPLMGLGDVVYQEVIPMFYRNIQMYGIECPICGTSCKCGAKIKLLRLRSIR